MNVISNKPVNYLDNILVFMPDGITGKQYKLPLTDFEVSILRDILRDSESELALITERLPTGNKIVYTDTFPASGGKGYGSGPVWQDESFEVTAGWQKKQNNRFNKDLGVSYFFHFHLTIYKHNGAEKEIITLDESNIQVLLEQLA